MSGKCFVDTNVLVYAHDISAGDKHILAAQLISALWESRDGMLSTQVLQEFCINARRKAKLPGKQVAEIVQDLARWKVVVNTTDSILGALAIEAQHRLSFWDSLIVFAAQSGGAEILYSEDLSDGQVYGSVRVVNPLAGRSV
jgi:predicted nucleic acid-binding protein